jgi:hypothetical protein|uniref:Uncharacterized protein n=1 Tax=Mus musculus TaxID=10090 RepID=Q3TNR8_MOUSE|nr:unnamed protein product [Mus musculus]
MFIPQVSLLIVFLHLVTALFSFYFGLVLGKFGVGSEGDGMS